MKPLLQRRTKSQGMVAVQREVRGVMVGSGGMVREEGKMIWGKMISEAGRGKGFQGLSERSAGLFWCGKRGLIFYTAEAGMPQRLVLIFSAAFSSVRWTLWP